MKKRHLANQYLLIIYTILNLAYKIGNLLEKTLFFIISLPLHSFNLIRMLGKYIFRQIINTINILIVYIYRLRYVFLIIATIYLSYFACDYYLSISNPKTSQDFIKPGQIIITDRKNLPLYNSNEITQQLISDQQPNNQLNKKQLAQKLVKKTLITKSDWFKEKIIALRIAGNFSQQELQILNLQLLGKAIYDYQQLALYKRSPVIVGWILKNLTQEYGQNLFTKNLTIKTSLDLVEQNKLQQTALENKNFQELNVVYQPDSHEIIAVINQYSHTALTDFEKIINEKKLTLSINQKQLANNFNYLFTN